MAHDEVKSIESYSLGLEREISSVNSSIEWSFPIPIDSQGVALLRRTGSIPKVLFRLGGACVTRAYLILISGWRIPNSTLRHLNATSKLL